MSPDAPTARMLDIGWARIRVDVRTGTSDQHPLVLLNGIGAALEVLQPLVDALGREVTTIRLDVPGTGESPPLPLPYGMVQMSWLVDAVVRRLHPGPVDLLGYSWGGALAQQMAVQFPRRYRRLILISASPGALSVPGSPTGFATMLTPRRFEDPEEVAALSALLGSGRGSADSAAHAQQAGGWGAAEPARMAGAGIGYGHQLAALATWTSLPFLPLLRQPTLLISGDDDPIVPAANSRLIAGLIPGSVVHLIPGDHTEIITAAPEIAALITAFRDDSLDAAS